MNRKRIVYIAAAIVLAVSGLLLMFNKKEKVAIGFIADFSAKSSSLGMLSRNGALMAIDEINSHGGLLGRELELIVRDNRGDIEISRSITKEFISDEVPLVIGPHLSRSALVMMEESKDQNILIISPVVSTDNAVGIDDNFFRMNTSASADGRNLASAVIGQGDTNVAVLWSRANREYTAFITAGAKSELEKNNVNIVYEKEFSGKEDFTGIVDDLLKLEVDGIVFSSISKDAALIVQLYAKRAALPHLYGCQWNMATDILSSGGKTVEGMILIGEHLNLVPLPGELEFIKKYRDTYSTDPNFSSIYAYESIKLFADVAEEIGRNWNLLKIKEEVIRRRKFEGVTGTFEIDQYGDVSRAKSLYIIENNRYELYSQN